MSRTKKKIINIKTVALFLILLMVGSIIGIFNNISFAVNEVKLCFKGDNWGAASIDSDGWAVYDFAEKGTVKLKIAKKSNNSNYEYISINSNYENDIQFGDESEQYAIAIQDNMASGFACDLALNGTNVIIPGVDEGQEYKMYGLFSDSFNSSIVNVDVGCRFPGNPDSDPNNPNPFFPGNEEPDIQIWIDGNKVIDEKAEPPVIEYNTTQLKIKKGDYYASYEIAIPSGGTTIGNIKVEGHGVIVINPSSEEQPGNDPAANIISADNNGISISSTESTSNIDIETKQGGGAGSLILEGGIDIGGCLRISDRDLQIGTQSNKSSKGIKASNLLVNYATLKMNCSGELFSGIDTNNKMVIYAEDKSVIDADTTYTGTALTNVNLITVRSGGDVFINTAGTVGDVDKKVYYFDFVDFNQPSEPNQFNIIENFKVMSDLTNGNGTATGHDGRYEMTSTASSLKLKSLAKPMWTLSFNMEDPDGNIIQDTKVENGTVRIKAACGIGYGEDPRTAHDFMIEEGTPVTVELLPDYGYQFTSGAINGTAITIAQNDVATYKFNMPAGHIHFSALFTKCEDSIVISENSNIIGASVSNLEGKIKGNAEFNVNNVEDVDEDKFSDKADGATIVGFTNLSMNEVILKGNETDAWKTPVTELDDAMTVNLQVSDEMAEKLKDSKSVKMLRDHEGTVESIDATYNKDTKMVSFNTDKYSTYAIAYSLTESTAGAEKTEVVKTGDMVLLITLSTITLVIIANVIVTKNTKKRK